MSNIILIIYALTSSLGLVLLKLGSKTGAPISFVDHKLQFNLGFYAISGVILYGLSFLIYTYLISKNDLGYIIPVSTALVYIFIFAASFIIFKETFTAIKIAGIFFILGGLILLNLSK
jgi:drug/metabolite transporter (DMT)-like permease